MAKKTIDFIKKREESIEKKRRSIGRIVFKNVLGVYTVIDSQGSIYPIEVVDISQDGCLFQVPWNPASDKKLKNGHEVPLRMYFTRQSFIHIRLKVKHSKEHEQGDRTFMRYGCIFDKSLSSFTALSNFIDFLYSFAEHSALDRGNDRVSFL